MNRRDPARARHALVLFVLAALVLCGAGCKGEKTDEEAKNAPAAVSAVRVEAGEAAPVEAVGDVEAQKALLAKGAGEIDTTTVLRMMGSNRAQRAVLRTEPLRASGLAKTVLGALPAPFRAEWDAALAKSDGLDPIEAIDSLVFWSDAKRLKDEDMTTIYVVAVTRGDTLARAVNLLDELDDDDSDDKKTGPVPEGFAAVVGTVDAATRTKLIETLEADATEDGRPLSREDLGADHVLFGQAHSRQGVDFVYIWPRGAVLGHSNAQGEVLDVAREAAAKFVREVEAARGGSGGELDPTLVVDARLAVESDQAFDVNIALDEQLRAVIELPRAALGGDPDKAMLGFEQIAEMSADELDGMVGKMGVPAPLQPLAVVVLDTLHVDESGDTVTFSVSPAVAAIEKALAR